MREVSLERSGAVEPTRLLQQVERQLMALGYAVAARSVGELHFVTTHGAPHRLRIRVEPQRTVFTFAPAALGTPLPPDEELERRVEAALGRVTALPSAARPQTSATRCSICATVIPSGASACPLCGMPV
ncbi:MAG: hypothetical protein ACOZQL_11655 [Myxococcota bacterium]